MAQLCKIIGVSSYLAKLKSVSSNQVAAIARGLKKGGLFIQRASTDIVPIQTGNLRASAFTRSDGHGKDTIVTTGYTAAYAIYVHEDQEARHGIAFNEHYKDMIDACRGLPCGTVNGGMFERGPHQRAKFIEVVIMTRKAEILNVILSEVLLT